MVTWTVASEVPRVESKSVEVVFDGKNMCVFVCNVNPGLINPMVVSLGVPILKGTYHFWGYPP